jgi:hypothetical protein
MAYIGSPDLRHERLEMGGNGMTETQGKWSFDRWQRLPEDMVGNYAGSYEKAQRRPDANDRSIHSDRPRSTPMVRLIAHVYSLRGLSWLKVNNRTGADGGASTRPPA